MVAFAIAIAIHEVLAGFVPSPRFASRPEPERVSIQRITIARVTPKPKPSPSPTPTPLQIARAHVIAAAAAPRQAIHRAGSYAKLRVATIVPASRAAAAVPATGDGTGAGNADGAGSLGNGTNGTGPGGSAPCGFVELSDPHGSHYDPSTGGFHVDIRLSVQFPDAHRESMILDYPFYYPSEAASPWSGRNLHNTNVPMLMQRPPPDRAASEPPLVQYVLQHTGADGFTLLEDCPTAAP